MSFNETRVAKLDKVDISLFKELRAEEEDLQRRAGAFRAKAQAFWESLRIKHSLPYGKTHYIKGNSVYDQEVSKVT